MQLISTLFRSALEFIEARQGVDGRLELQTRRVEDRVTIRISDNGAGVPDADVDNVFCQGYTTAGGLGSRLHHGANLVREMGGAIEMVTPGINFTFAIVLSLPISGVSEESD